MAGFWAGFGEEVVSSINKREDFIREQTQRRQDYLRTVGVPAIQQRNLQMKEDMNLITSAVNLGLRQEVAVAAYEAGHIETVLDNIAKASDVAGAANFYNTKQKLTSDYAAKAEDPMAVIKMAWGVDAENIQDLGTEEGRQTNIFKTMFALDPDRAIDTAVGKSSINGYTEADAASAMGASRSYSRPAGYVYENLPASLGTGRDTSETFAKIQTNANSISKSLADFTKTDFQIIGDTVTIKGENAGVIRQLSLDTARVVAQLEDDKVSGAAVAQDMNAIANAYLTIEQSQIPDWEGYSKALDMLSKRYELKEIFEEYPPAKKPKPGMPETLPGSGNPPTSSNGNDDFGEGVPIED